jgi:hypothetical protein
VRQDEGHGGGVGLLVRRGSEGGRPGDACARLWRRCLQRGDADLHRATGRYRGVVEILHAESNPYTATIGLRVEPTCEGTGGRVPARRANPDRAAVHLQTRESFAEHTEAYVHNALVAGLRGWQVTDCVVTMTRCVYAVPDGPPSCQGSFRRWRDRAPPSRPRRCEASCRSSRRRSRPRGRTTCSGPCRLDRRRGRARVHVRGLPKPVSAEQPTCQRTTPNPLKLVEYGMHGAHSAWHASV